MLGGCTRRRWLAGVAGLLAAGAPATAQKTPSFVNFESGHVRPLAFVDTPTTDLLLAVNTPDDRLAVYTVTATGLTLAAEVPVGLEPVAVAARQRAGGLVEAYVVNHLSDSVSVVTIDPAAPAGARVVRTLLVGDEPRDVVVAGPARDRIFVTAAHRGQNRPGDPQLTTPDVGRADVWVFDAGNLGAPLGGTADIVQLPGDTPRALAASADGRRVYAAVFLSGNRTTTVPAPTVLAAGGLPPPPPRLAPLPPFGDPPPSTGLIVRQEAATGLWQDELWRDWSSFVPFALPDEDVFVLDAAASPPKRAASANAVAGVGTVIFNLAVRPGTGAVYATNLEARNQVRFESTLQGHIAESRVTIVHGTTPTSVHLNPHILYDGHEGLTPGPAPEVEESLAFPTDLAFSSDGATLYVAGLGSGKVGVFDVAGLEAGSASPRTLLATGAGPSGLALDEARDRLYVMHRLDHTITTVSHVSDPALRSVGPPMALPYTPEPALLRSGRAVLYDAQLTSAHGDAACASCHVFGDFDGLAWDLGNPFAQVFPDLNPHVLCSAGPNFHPLKGPMTTQTLRGLADAGPMHWRGDRTGAGLTVDGFLDEFAALLQFKPAFAGLLGRDIDDAAMLRFTHFVFTIRYPPNPMRALDRSLSPDESAGLALYNQSAETCVNCHAFPLGTDGKSSCDLEPQNFKVAQLRNLYQKVGRFGMPPNGSFNIPAYTVGAQVRGFGFTHDGGVSSLDDFLKVGVFQLSPTQRAQLAAFLFGFDTGLAPAVGQQVTVTAATVNEASVVGRVSLLMGRADAGDCDLVARGLLGAEWHGWLHDAVTASGVFLGDRAADPPITEAALRAQASSAGQERTYTCVPPGTGMRIGLDRDDDGMLDGDERDAGTPLDPPPDLVTTSTSTSTTTSTSSSTTTTMPPGTIPPGLLEKLKHTVYTIPPFHIPIPRPDPPPFGESSLHP